MNVTRAPDRVVHYRLGWEKCAPDVVGVGQSEEEEMELVSVVRAPGKNK